jgi:hypothetical protein
VAGGRDQHRQRRQRHRRHRVHRLHVLVAQQAVHGDAVRLFGTLWSLPAKTIASQWGRIVDAVGYPTFFVYTAVVACRRAADPVADAREGRAPLAPSAGPA